MILIAISHERGYSGVDHLLNDSELQDIVGRHFRCIADIRRAARKLDSGAQRKRDVPIWIRVAHPDGTTTQHDTLWL